MIRFVGDENGERLKDADGNDIQGFKGPIIFVHDANKDCLSWLTSTSEAWNIDNGTSFPIGLFREGYDVYFACRRGTEYSRSHETLTSSSEDVKTYFNYNTQTVGSEDMPRFVDIVNNNVN